MEMDPALRRAWTQIVTGDDYDEHMARIGQAQAGAGLTCQILRSAEPPVGGRVVIAGAGTGQALDYADTALFRPFRLTFTDLNPAFLARLAQRLAKHGLAATVLEDDIEQTAIEPGPDLLLATLLLEHIDWRRGVEQQSRNAITTEDVRALRKQGGVSQPDRLLNPAYFRVRKKS